MSGKKYILTIDEGTSQCKTALWDGEGNMLYLTSEELHSVHPHPGEVEQDPLIIVDIVRSCVKKTLDKAHCDITSVGGIGLTNQRESTVIWNKKTGNPVYNAIVWQDRRGEWDLKKLSEEERSRIKDVTGLIPDPYFSVSKIRWILENKLKSRKIEDIAFGTIDAWLVWNLSEGHRHISDVSNASRTMIYDIRQNEWSEELMNFFRIPESILPEAVDSASSELSVINGFGSKIPLSSMAGDQQASLFGHGAFDAGDTKCTYGTGSFVLMNTGTEVKMRRDLLTSIGWRFSGMRPEYCIEGSAFNTGSVIKWIRDSMNLISATDESESIAMKASPDHGVIFVPALAGLGAPFWHPTAKGTIFGITGKTTPFDIVRSALESVAFRIRDIYEIMSRDGSSHMESMRVDGGPTMNRFLMQFQADILGLDIHRSVNSEMTSAGVAYMAGIVNDWWSREDIKDMGRYDKPFHPSMNPVEADRLYAIWKRSIDSVINHYPK